MLYYIIWKLKGSLEFTILQSNYAMVTEKLELSKNATPIQTKDLFIVPVHTWWRAQASKIGRSTWRGSDHLTNRLGTNSDAVIKCLQNAILNASSANWLSSPSSSSSLSSPFVKTLRDQCQNLPRLLQIVYLFELSKDTYSVSPGHMSWDNFQQNAT